MTARAGAPIVAVAGLTARWLAESAVQAGWRVIALDLFGDLDTRRVAATWHPIGRPGRLAIDVKLLRHALAAARDAGACGWIGGGGVEASPALLEAGGPGLPRWGMSSEAVAAVRSPRQLFGMLDRLGLAHPAVAWTAPADPAGWLCKRANASGGWGVCHAGQANQLTPDAYFQRLQAGAAMSVLCLADGRNARLVALQHQRVVEQGSRFPYVFAGVAGPVSAPALERRVEAALALLVPAFGLRGLLSLDFIDVDGVPHWLEINPRPSASMQLYREAWPEGLLAAHREALAGRLPATAPQHPGHWHGVQTVYADRAGHLPLATVSALAADPRCHDLPAPGSRLSPGEPVCTVSAHADTADALEAALQQGVAAVQARLAPRRLQALTEETCS